MELAASSRICSRENAKSRLGEDVLVEQVGAEHGGVVGVEGDHEAAFEVLAERVLVEGGAAAGADVGGEVDFEGDLALGEDCGGGRGRAGRRARGRCARRRC